MSDAKVFHAHLWGTRKHKYAELRDSDMTATEWVELTPEAPFHLLATQQVDLKAEYDGCVDTSSTFGFAGRGVKTHRDHFAVSFDLLGLRERLGELRNPNVATVDLAERYGLEDTSGWALEECRQTLLREESPERDLVRYTYRPLDFRLLCHHKALVDRPREQVMAHLRQGGNLALCLGRQGLAVGAEWDLVTATAQPIDTNCFRRGGIQVYPIYCYPSARATHRELLDASPWPRSSRGRVPNLSRAFVAAMAERLGLAFVSDGVGDLGLASADAGATRNAAVPAARASADAGATRNAAVPAARASADAGATRNAAVPAARASADAGSTATFGPEDVFHYIYAVFHAPTYRERYAEFLKIDFPRVPLTSDVGLFRALCGLGADLVALHLLEDEYPHASWNRQSAVRRGAETPRPHQRAKGGPEGCPLASLITRYPVPGDNTVAKGHPKYLAPGNLEPGTGNPLPSGRVYISKDDPKGGTHGQYFEGVPPEVWAFHVGGYQVGEKWLKDRRGRQLSYEDLTHYQRVVVALNETIRLMSEIDAAVDDHGGWPIT